MRYIITGSAFILTALISTSCSVTQGSLAPTSHYVYPNSNVTPLGSTNAQISKFGIIFPPSFRARDLDRLYGNAMSRHSGANLIINNKVDSKNTFLVIFHFMKVTLSGTAAKMEVGKQDIGQENFVPADNDTPEQGQPQQVQSQSLEPSPEQPGYQPLPPAKEKEKIKKIREPLKPFQIGLQANYIKRDYLKPGFGVNAEIFLSKRLSLAPSFNVFPRQRIDIGFGMGTFEAKQSAFYTDLHFTIFDNIVSPYALASISYENTSITGATQEDVFSGSELGLGIGAGISGNLLNRKLHPFLEVKYVAVSPITYVESTPEESLHARLTWGLKYSLGR